MRYLVLSDIHGNRFGLDAVLAAENDYDALLCLGDVVGYGAHPNECCETLRARKALCLLGNHDAAALGEIDINWFNPVAKTAALWTRKQLSMENRAWLSGLSPYQQFDGFEAVHGSLRQPLEEYILDVETIEPNLLLMSRPLCFFGHTHLSAAFGAPAGAAWTRPDQLRGAMLPTGGLIEREKDMSYLVNPGSCGQPRDGNAQARYAIYDTNDGSIDVRAIDYDKIAAKNAIYKAGLPPMLGDRLLIGE